MNDVILFKRTSMESIENILLGVDLHPMPIRRGSPRIAEEANLLIRWGTTKLMRSRYQYNSSEGVRLASNKGQTRSLLHSEGVAVPSPVELSSVQANDYPLVVRPERHQMGRNFYLVNSRSELNRAMRRIEDGSLYISKFYPKTREFRVHVASGKVLLIQEKVSNTPLRENWSHGNGFVFKVIPWKDYRLDVILPAIKAIEVVGLDFGAVDILADPTDSRLPSTVVCEINTAPRVEGYTAQRYSEYFNWALNTKETRHFSVPNSTPARHYVFKHRELQDCDYDFNFSGENNGRV